MPDGTPASAVLTSAKVVQLPVLGTATEPSTVPVGEPVRSWIVPPGAAGDHPGAERGDPGQVDARGTPAQSPGSM